MATQSNAPASKSDVLIKGVWWPFFVTERALDAIRDCQVRDDDVWIATWPKAGTHWIAEICHLIHQNGDLEKVDRAQEPTPLEFDAAHGENRVPRYKLAPSWNSPRVLVTHVSRRLLPEQVLAGKGKVINVIRNLKDSLVSYYHFLTGQGMPMTFDETLQKYLYSDKVQFSSWFDHVAEYWAERHNKQYLVLKYEDVKTDTRGAVIQIADFLGRPLSDEAVDKIVDAVTVKSMRARYNASGDVTAPGVGKKGKIGAANLVRKGIVGDWKTMFTVAQSEAFDELYRQKIAGLGLKLQFE